ncbi:MAG: alginate export family protein [bacterium]
MNVKLSVRCAAVFIATLVAFPAFAASGPVRDFSSLSVGDWVEAEVEIAPSGGWMTREIDMKGRIESAAGSITGPLARVSDGEITLLGVPVVVTPETSVKDTAGENISLSELEEGAMVEARFVRDGRGLVATKLRARSADTSPEIEGPVESLIAGGAPTLRVVGFDLAVAEDVEVRDASRRPRFAAAIDDDDLILGRRVSLGRFVFGGDARAEVRPERNYDLNSDKAKDLTNSDLSGRIEVIGGLSDRYRVYGKGSYRRRIILEDERGTKDGYGKWELSEAYMTVLGVGRPEVALQFGRQRIEEKREWLYDENLDGVRLHWLGQRVTAELSASTRFGDDIPELAATWNTIASASAIVTPDVTIGAYAIRRTPREDRTQANLTWYGAHIVSAKIGRLRGWGDASILRGSDGSFDVEAHAAHLSASYLVSRPGRVMINASAARGSGDADLTDGRDGNFRQTGLHDNNDRYGGVTSFRYYGELSRPSLSNMDILSAGLGCRPAGWVSIDVLGYRYRQVEAAPVLRESDLEAVPLGLHRDLGRELDLVVGLRSARAIKIEYVLAGFWAGKAFPSDTERAVTNRLQLDVGF